MGPRFVISAFVPARRLSARGNDVEATAQQTTVVDAVLEIADETDRSASQVPPWRYLPVSRTPASGEYSRARRWGYSIGSSSCSAEGLATLYWVSISTSAGVWSFSARTAGSA